MTIDFRKLCGDSHPYANVQGHILRLETETVVVPYEATGNGWNCVVVEGNEHYRVGGYNIFVDHARLLAAERVPVLPKTKPGEFAVTALGCPHCGKIYESGKAYINHNCAARGGAG